MGAIVERSRAQIERHTGSSIGFYTSGQLLLEEYYTLSVIGKAGIGTPHMDGNTRLCTATAAAASLARACAAHLPALEQLAARYGEAPEEEAEAIYRVLFHGPRSGGVGLLRDLQDLYLLASMCDVTWKMLRQAGLGLRDDELSSLSVRALHDTSLQLSWLLTRMKTSAPQALVVG